MQVLTGTNKATNTEFILVRGLGDTILHSRVKIFVESSDAHENAYGTTLKCYPEDNEDMLATLEYMRAEEFNAITNGYDLQNASVRFGKFIGPCHHPESFAIITGLSDTSELNPNVFANRRLFVSEDSEILPRTIRNWTVIKYRSSTNDIVNKVKNLSYSTLKDAIFYANMDIYKVLDLDTLSLVDKESTTKPVETPSDPNVSIQKRIDDVLQKEANRIVNDLLEKLEAYFQEHKQSNTLIGSKFTYNINTSCRVMNLVEAELKKHLDERYLSVQAGCGTAHYYF